MEQKLITIEQARQKLREKGKKMTDQQIQKFLDLLFTKKFLNEFEKD